MDTLSGYANVVTVSSNTAPVVLHVPTDEPGFWSRRMDAARQFMCGLSGHDTTRITEGTHVFLRCMNCGFDTPGWVLDEAPPTMRFRGDADRHKMEKPVNV